jgi:hypothetical protein
MTRPANRYDNLHESKQRSKRILPRFAKKCLHSKAFFLSFNFILRDSEVEPGRDERSPTGAA